MVAAFCWKNMKEKIELRKQSKKLSPIINIGKSGLTANVVLSLDRLLKQRNLIKIKAMNYKKN